MLDWSIYYRKLIHQIQPLQIVNQINGKVITLLLSKILIMEYKTQYSPLPVSRLNSSGVNNSHTNTPKSYRSGAYYHSSNKKERIPGILQIAVRSRMSAEKVSEPSQYSDKINNLQHNQDYRANLQSSRKNIKICQICEMEMSNAINPNQEMFVSNCQHKANFCQSCLHHYVIYKVNIFEEVQCPQEACPAILDTSSLFFKNLPTEIQQKYRKIHNFYTTSKNPDLKMCPREHCQGILQPTDLKQMVCSSCKGVFCRSCLLKAHEGECESQQLKFFQQNLHYRQCKECKFVIEKNQGCNHMTCRCGYQFCYVCGEKWDQDHECLRNGEVEAEPDLFDPYEEETFCQHFGRIFCRVLVFILKLPIKIALFFLFIPMLLINVITHNVVVIVLLGFVSVVSGMFCYSFRFLCQLRQWYFLLGILFLPVTMLVGIKLGFDRIFCLVVPQQILNTWRMVSFMSRTICCF